MVYKYRAIYLCLFVAIGIAHPSQALAITLNVSSLYMEDGTIEFSQAREPTFVNVNGPFVGVSGSVIQNYGISDAVFTSNQNVNTTYAGVIRDGGPDTGVIYFNKTGSGTLTLSGSNTFTGPTDISGGALDFNGGSLLTSVVTVDSGGTLGGINGTLGTVFNNGGTVLSDGLSIANLSFTGTGAVTWAISNSTSTSAPLKVGMLTTTGADSVMIAAMGSRADLTRGAAYPLLAYGAQDGEGGAAAFAFSIPYRSLSISTEAGSSNLVLLTYSGSSGYHTNWTGANGTTFYGGNNWALSNGTSGVTDYNQWDDIYFGDTAGTGAVNININACANSTNFDNNTLNYTLSGSGGISSGSLAKTGSGKLTINNANIYSGGTTLPGGSIVVSSDASLGATAGSLSIGAGTLEIAGGFSSSRKINLSDPAATISVDAGQVYNDSGTISGTGGLTKNGFGTMIVSGTAGMIHAVNVNAGRFQVDGILSATALDVDGTAQLAGTGSIAITASGGLLYQSSAASTFGGTLAGAGSLEVASGTLILSGTDSYQGATLVDSASTLIAASKGAIPNGTGLTISAGGTLRFDSTAAAAPLADTAPAGSSPAAASASIAAVPEPCTLALLAAAGALLAVHGRRRRR